MINPSKRSGFRSFWIISLLALAYLLIRLLEIDRFVTSDEPLWLGRSANFLTALLNSDPAGTFQFAHPGVMTMWSGALAIWLIAPEYASTFSTPIEYVFNIHLRLRENGADPLNVMVAARISKIILQTAIFAIATGFLIRNYGRPIAIIAGSLIALDPFTSAIDSVLHVDGLAAICMVTAILALPVEPGFARNTAARWMLAGTLGGMAVLTRWMSLIVFLPVALMLAFHLQSAWTRKQPGRGVRLVLFGGSIFTGTLILICLLLWPALWNDPEMVISGIWEFSSKAGWEGHELPTYFLGETHLGNPGPWFYPVALIWRSTPVVLLGMGFFCVTFIMNRCRIINSRMSVSIATLALAMTLLMTVADKKFDRYLLTANLVLMIFSAIGIWSAVGWVASHWKPGISEPSLASRSLSVALIAILIGAQFITAMSALPYRFAWFNPVLGGTAAAERNLQLGWGEGMDQAARIIEEDHKQEGSGTSSPTVRVTVNREQILYFLPDTYVVYPHKPPIETVQEWEDTDYFVLSIQRWQRNLNPDIHDYLWQFEPLDSVCINGVEYMRVYKLNEIPPPPWLTAT